LVVDGVRVVFQLTPETEAPAEMNFYFPDLKALCMAENCSHTMHNLVPIRGALVRNALNWSKYLNESLQLFGVDAEVLFASHNWPRWGNADLREFLVLQRDLYKWMHDQTMRLANKGYTALEIAEELELPLAASMAISCTTPRRCISDISVGTTATRPTCTSCRQSTSANDMSNWQVVLLHCYVMLRSPLSVATTGGWQNW
jgi:hypothetical protein